MYPNLFHIGPLTIHTYGVFMAIGFVLGLRMAVHYGKRENIQPAVMTDLVIYIFVAALIGAKLLLLVVDFDYYSQDWRRVISIYEVGGVYYGGLLLALVVSIWLIRRKKLGFWRTSDILITGLPLGQAFGRFGCFFAGCCWGKEAPGLPFAVTFTNPLAAEQLGTPLHIPLHASQLYEAFPMLLLFLILAYAYNRRKFYGQQLCLYLFLYSILRFSVEFYRGDPRGFWGPLSTSQWISMVAFAGAMVIYFLRAKFPAVAKASTGRA